MYVDSALEEHVGGLVDEMEAILKEHLIEDGDTANPYMRRVDLIRAEIESLGFLVTFGAILDVTTMKLINVKVTLHHPGDFLTPELEGLYREGMKAAKARYEQIKKEA